MPKEKLTATDVELAVARFFNYRQNVIVPNIYLSWYECDLLIISHARYATEVEIKVTASDVKADKKKSHGHRTKKIRRFFFAVPESLKDCPDLPQDAGLIVVPENGYLWDTKIVRRPRYNKEARPLTQEEYMHVLHLGCMRIWSLKEHIDNLKEWRKKDGLL